jgi:lactate dehydrogenase-like 2-hydroxyacid dehydrogenase
MRNGWYCQNTDTILSIGADFNMIKFFEACPNVKAIALYSVGFDHVDIKEANQRNIPGWKYTWMC